MCIVSIGRQVDRLQIEMEGLVILILPNTGSIFGVKYK